MKDEILLMLEAHISLITNVQEEIKKSNWWESSKHALKARLSAVTIKKALERLPELQERTSDEG